MNDITSLFEQASKEWELGNYESAFGLFETAAKQGDAASQNNLGYFYDEGIGVKVDKNKAILWYKKAVENGEISSCSNLAKIYQDDGDAEKAIIWLDKAVSAGDGDAALELAKLYLDSTFTNKNEKAKECLTLILKSDSVTQDSVEEAHALLKSIDSGQLD